MEPTDLNPSDPADRSLEDLLRSPVGESLPDDGFSARVLAALPAKSERFFGSSVWFGVGLFAALALVLGPGRFPEIMGVETVSLGGVVVPVFTALTDPTLLLVLAISGAAWVLVSDDEELAFTPPSAP